MKRDMDLIREILIKCVDQPRGYAPDPLEIQGYSRDEVGYHVYLLHDAGLIVGQDASIQQGNGPLWLPLYVTWKGHDFVEASRNEGRWQEAKKKILQKAGEASFKIWTAVLTQIMKNSLDLLT